MGIAHVSLSTSDAGISGNAIVNFAGRSCFGGKPLELEDIIQTHARQVRAIIRGILRSHSADWSDIEQTVWIRIMERIDSFHGRSDFGTWVYRIVVNICYDYLRRIVNSRLADDPGDLNTYATKDVSVDARIARKDLVFRLMRVLSESDAQLFRDYADGTPVSELAATYNLTPNTVKTRVFRIRRKLIKQYERLETAGNARRLSHSRRGDNGVHHENA